MSLLSLASAAREAAPVAVTNLTPTFYAMCVAIVGLFGILVRQWVPYKKLLVDEDASLRSDLLKRISDLESTQVDMQRRHEDEMREERRRCDEEMSKVRAQLDGLQRMIVQWQITSGRALELGHGHSPEAAKSIERVEEHLHKREREA